MTIENATVNADEPGGANIHSNGNIDLIDKKVLVDGNASAVGTITGETITGMITCPSPPIQFPGDYSELYKAMAQEVGTYNGDLTLSGGTLENPIIFPGPDHEYAYIDGDLTIWTGSFVRLTSTIYITGSLTMKPGSLLEGRENILAEQNIEIGGGAYVSDLVPVIICKNGDIACKSGGPGSDIINAVVYAPNGNVEITVGAILYGAVGGKTVLIKNAVITYAAELHGRQDLPGGELATISYSYK
ncbi:hypothetical protein ES703_64174 [subsurface metagenome]